AAEPRMSGSRLMSPATRNTSPLAGKSPGAIRRTIAFLKRLCNAWKQDRASRMAAALAYYTFLALAPLLILTVLIAGMLFGEAAARSEIVEWTKEATGAHGAEMVQGILQGPGRPREGIVPLVLGVLVLLVGACRAFQELQKGLSRILAG